MHRTLIAAAIAVLGIATPVSMAGLALAQTTRIA